MIARVTHLITGLKPSGAELLLLEITSRLVRRGWECNVLSLRHGEMVANFQSRGVPAVSLERAKADPWILGEVRRFLSAYKPAILHTHLFEAECMAWLATLGDHSISLMSTRHGLDSFRLRPGLAWLNRMVNQRMKCILAVSGAARDFCLQQEKLTFPCIQVVYNGVDTTRFRPMNEDERHVTRARFGLAGQPMVGILGRLVELKGHCYLLEAWPHILAHLPNACLVVIGDGPLRADLERHARSRGIDRSIIFLRHQAQKLPDLLAALDLVVSASTTEGFPMAVIEAMATGCPLIATCVGGVPEAVVSEVGRLVPPKNSTAIAEAVVEVLSDRDRYQAMRIAARARTVAQFDIEQCVDNIEQAYRRVLSNVRASAD